MILIDTFNIEWTWNEFWRLPYLGSDCVLYLLYAWLACVAFLLLSRAFFKRIKIYDDKEDDLMYKFGFWVVTIVTWGIAFWIILDGTLLHTSSSFDGFWIIALFGFIAYNVLKILSRH